MVKELQPIDITDTPEFLRLAQEVRASRQPRVLRSASEEIALLVPIPSAPKPRSSRSRGGTRASAVRRATLESTAGSLKPPVRTEDIETMIADAKEEHAERTKAKLNRQ